ncbi:type I DNA topoisomerase [Leptospira biflexa]|uniref:type I DNA topoisomerase n=1 Tax=Leptospira biflexa TaxID=172 RepID=UPI0010835C40|nr:type I DNA topoisomerase [Leptospira biflexa]TGM35053.1 type I DNA topoisomerase [Leptospira biflexa]TGM38513.1 type I DNA topoisomerase [Leptospira biflexa]
MVESPTKAATITSYLGKDWLVVATKGHIKDLPPKSYGVDLSNQFEPEYEWLKGKKSLFTTITTKAKKCSLIYIASDPDREGEIIAKHCFDELSKLKKPIFRLRLKEITKEELQSQIQKKIGLDQQEIESQIARRVIDRIFGFEVSPDLWKHLKIPSLSAGRVQSTVLHWICEREKEIQNFSKENYFQLKLIGTLNENPIELKYQSKEKLKQEEIQTILNGIQILPDPSRLKNIVLSNLKIKKIKRNPPKAFSTASLLESSFRALQFDSKKTMRLAQSLFEGKKLHAGETVGLITYMRSDSTRVSESKQDLGEKYLKEHYPNLLWEGSRNQGKQKKFSQDAHEAITPINPSLSPEQIKSFLTLDEWKLYQLIWERFLTSLLKPEIGEEIVYEFPIGKHIFEHSFETISDPGFKNFPRPKEKRGKISLNAKIGDLFFYESYSVEEKETEPPQRYTQGKLIQKMEDTGVGRPSTYATILETLKLRKYIVEYKKNIGPSQLGLKVDSYLFLNFHDLIGESFTKDLESKLDQITDEKASRVKLVANFYDQLKQILKSPRKKMVSIGKENQSKVKYDTDEKQTLSEKVKNGKGSEKKGNTKNQNQSLTYIENKTCPKCLDGYVKTKLGKNGKTIYFCSRYPHCDYITYDN